MQMRTWERGKGREVFTPEASLLLTPLTPLKRHHKRTLEKDFHKSRTYDITASSWFHSRSSWQLKDQNGIRKLFPARTANELKTFLIHFSPLFIHFALPCKFHAMSAKLLSSFEEYKKEDDERFRKKQVLEHETEFPQTWWEKKQEENFRRCFCMVKNKSIDNNREANSPLVVSANFSLPLKNDDEENCVRRSC